MTILQLAAFFHATGSSLAWLIAVALGQTYRTPYFRAWTTAYGCGALVASIELLKTFTSLPREILSFEIGVLIACASLFWAAGRLLEGRVTSRWLAPTLAIATMLVSYVLLGSGVAFEMLVVPSIAFLSFAFLSSAKAVWNSGKRRGRWLAIAMILHGLIPWAQPFMVGTDVLWMGFWLIGLADLMVGLGIIVFALEEEASQLRRRYSDLSGSKDYLKRYRLLAEHARDIILILDPTGQVVEANQAAVQAYGYPHDELLTKSLRDLRAPETLAELDEQLIQAEAGGVLLETMHLTRDGTPFPVEISAQGMDLEGRRVLVSIIRDISERRRMEALLRDQNARLRELDRLKGDFINAASHELRTPLTSIKGYAEFLEDEVGGPLNDDQQAFVFQIQEGAKRLQRIIDDMLDFARLEAGTFKLVLQEADLLALVEQEVSSMAPQVAEAKVTLALHLAAAPIAVRMDPRRFGQVLLNLLSNAIKFTPAGGTITVSVTTCDGHVRLSVEDTGIGIAPEHVSRLFEKFYQVDPSTTRQHGGAGLGLAISKALIEAHEGEIGVESEVGRGSTFWITLPLAARPAIAPMPEQGLQEERIGID